MRFTAVSCLFSDVQTHFPLVDGDHHAEQATTVNALKTRENERSGMLRQSVYLLGIRGAGV